MPAFRWISGYSSRFDLNALPNGKFALSGCHLEKLFAIGALKYGLSFYRFLKLPDMLFLRQFLEVERVKISE